jgi:serine/threonine protein phosphatase PrpC
MLDLEFSQLSHPGRQRNRNEDCLGYFAPSSADDARSRGWLFALADGVGGQDRGEVAARVAVDTVVQGFGKASKNDALTTVLPKLVQAANAKVYETAMHAGPGGSSMATTMVACALRYDRAIVAHAGDSRCYLIRQGYAASVTRDHTVSSEQLRMGLITAGEARAAKTAHVLSRSLGGNMFLNVETSEHQIFAGDLLLQCSDGLHHSLKPEDIARLTGGSVPLEQATQDLIELANERDGSDNISVQLVRVKAVERVGMYRGRHYKLH